MFSNWNFELDHSKAKLRVQKAWGQDWIVLFQDPIDICEVEERKLFFVKKNLNATYQK